MDSGAIEAFLTSLRVYLDDPVKVKRLLLLEKMSSPANNSTKKVLRVSNQLAKNNSGFQEKACLVGLILSIINIANSEHPKEMQMQATLFYGQLCQTSIFTLQTFIACKDLPVFVGFLKPDYAKNAWSWHHMLGSLSELGFCILEMHSVI
ncbi:hypothetical protein KP509_22G028600 [Ceratopteris richardii]|nr:hypothetical protein KP509_22G028600 [Ceratopteris richardii]